MKNIKNTIIASVTAIISFFLAYGGYNIYAAENGGPYGFDDPGMHYLFVDSAYHEEMNEYINSQVEKLNKMMDDKDFYKNPNFQAPADVTQDNFKTLCGKENVSTYCTSMWAMDRYLTYVTRMQEASSGLIFEDRPQTLTDALSLVKGSGEEVVKKIDESQEVLRAAMATYNEYRLAYPMHRQYREIIENLNRYKLALKDLRNYARLFPVKFVDASTAYCQ